MAETANLRLPLLQAAQAQKHVTVNEALLRIDALSQLVISSRSLATPPVLVQSGATFAVPAAADGAWVGAERQLALSINGGWEFVTPERGWRAWIADEGAPAVYDGTRWVAGAVALSTGGAALAFRVVEEDHEISAGTTSVTVPLIPAGSLVFGVTGRVIAELGGTATSFRVGVGGDAPDRYGSGIGTSSGAWFRGVTATPVAYYADTPLIVTAEGGAFGGGLLRIAVHLAEMGLPDL
jgi:hypothetical protein